MKRLLSILLPAAALSLAAAPMTGLDNLDNLELHGFQTNGLLSILSHGRPQAYQWRIQGKSAQVQSPLYHLQGFQMTIRKENSQEEGYLLESPQCTYDNALQQVRGNGPLHLTGPDGLDISGIGFDFYWKNPQEPPQVVLRETVRIQFPLSLVPREKGNPTPFPTPTPGQP